MASPETNKTHIPPPRGESSMQQQPQQQAHNTQQQQPQALQQQQAPPQAQVVLSANRILFLVVVSGADLDCLEDPRPTGPRYTRDCLRSLLQLLGCKPRLAYKVMLAVFQAVDQAVTTARQQRISRKTFQVHPHRNGKVYVSLTRADFMSLVSTCAAQYSYKISPSSEELKVACSLRERRRCVVVLLCGTSGSGKSTLASILASRLGITTVVSTDSIRHMLRSFISKESSPLLWASTYQAGECLGNSGSAQEACSSESERALCGYKAQCELLADHLELLVAGCEARTQSLICEGVHLNISSVAKLMSRHPSVLPFLVYIPSESKHVERMAVRAKYMTLDPNKNRYVRYMSNIRLIQEYLVRKADKYCVPRVDNSNVDRSVGIIHLTVMGCLRRVARGEPVLDPATGRTSMLAAEYAAVLDHLQGEKDRLAAATAGGGAGAAAAGAGAHAGAGAGSSGGSGSNQAGSSSSSNSKRLVAPPGGVGSQADAGCSSSSASHTAAAPGSSSEVKQLVHSQLQDQQQHTVAGYAQPDGAAARMPSARNGARSQTAVEITHVDACSGSSNGAGVGLERVDGAAGAAASPNALAAICSSQGDNASASARQQQHSAQQQQTRTPCSAMPGSSTRITHSDDAASSSTAAEGSSLIKQPGCEHASSAPGAAVQQQELVRGAEQAHNKPNTLPDCDTTRQQQQQLEPGGSSSPPGATAATTGETSNGRASAAVLQQQPGFTSSASSSDAGGVEGVCPPGTTEAAASDALAQAMADCSTGGGVSSSRGSSRRGSLDQQQQGLPNVQQQQQQPQWRRSQQQQQQDEEFEDLVSSGEELDGLGELGSSDNEGERFLQEYGSMCESTTCDEHDEYDEHDFGMGASGLRAWHGGMAKALWPSYSHVYNPALAAATATASSSNAAATAAAHSSSTSSSSGRALHSTLSAGPRSAAGSSSSRQAGLPAAAAGSNAAAAGLLRLAGDPAAAAASVTSGLPTVFEGSPQEGFRRPPLPHSLSAAHAGTAAAAAAAASTSGPNSPNSRAAVLAAQARGRSRKVRRSRSSSGHRAGAGAAGGGGGSSSNSTASIVRAWSGSFEAACASDGEAAAAACAGAEASGAGSAAATQSVV